PPRSSAPARPAPDPAAARAGMRESWRASPKVRGFRRWSGTISPAAWSNPGVRSCGTHAVKPMKRKITLILDDRLIRKLHVLAARRKSSLSALLREEFSRRPAASTRRRLALAVPRAMLQPPVAHQLEDRPQGLAVAAQ